MHQSAHETLAALVTNSRQSSSIRTYFFRYWVLLIKFIINVFFTVFPPKLFYGGERARQSVQYNATVHLDSESETSDDDEDIASLELLKETSDCKLTRFDLQAIIFNFIYFYKLYNFLDFTVSYLFYSYFMYRYFMQFLVSVV